MAQPLVIAHRGASGYLPEHTLEAAAYAHALGADYIEQDVVLTRDDVLIVNHDIEIDTTTDVAERFPDRARSNGRYYALDFTWTELQTLRVRERFDPATDAPRYPGRFPANGASFRLCTFEEQVRLIQGLNRSTGRNAGLYPEIKAPGWHAAAGRDPGRILLQLLARFGYTTADAPVFVQCFEAAELRRLRHELGTPLKLIQLLDTPAKDPIDPAALAEIATYAEGIGPHLSAVITAEVPPRSTQLVERAHAAGLLVHPYTVRADELPAGFASLEDLLDVIGSRERVDGFFTDHSDRALAWRRAQR